MNSPTVLAPDPRTGLITITAGYTPTTNIHEPDWTYAQFYLLPVIGPLSYLAWQRLNLYLPADDTQVPINHDELAWSLGASPGRLNRAINRLVKFHLAYFVPGEPDTLYVKRRAPTLNPVLLQSLATKCPTLAGAHAEQLDAAWLRPPHAMLEPPDNPAARSRHPCAPVTVALRRRT